MYDVRSAVGHLHEQRYLETYDREVGLISCKRRLLPNTSPAPRSRGLRKIKQSSIILRIHPRFSSSGHCRRQSAARFGAIMFSPNDALTGYDPRYISDGELGGP